MQSFGYGGKKLEEEIPDDGFHKFMDSILLKVDENTRIQPIQEYNTRIQPIKSKHFYHENRSSR